MRRALLVVAWLIGGSLVVGAVLLTGFRLSAVRRELQTREEAAPAAGRGVRAGDVEIFVTEAGPADGRPVVLVHGTGAWSEIWRPTLGALAAEGYRAIAIDLPPFGFSERPASGDYTTPTQSARIAGVLRALDLRDVTLVGHSFGASPTVGAALLEQSRVSRLILVSGALALREEGLPAQAPGRGTRVVLGMRPLREAVVAATATNPRMTRRLLRGMIARKDSATNANIAMLQRPMRIRGSTRELGRYLVDFLGDTVAPPASLPATYRDLRIPLALIWGDADTLTPLSQAEALRRLNPTATLTVLRGVGHVPAIEAPAELNAALLNALDLVGPRREQATGSEPRAP